MDTSGSSGSPSLTNLDEGRDTFETFLLCLLRVFTRLQRDSSNVATPDPIPISHTGIGNGNGDETVDISPEALNTLSSGQINSLVTSNSVNYDVIQQILLKQRQQVRSLPVATEMTESCESSGSGEVEMNSSSQAQSLQITPEQLKHVQAQIHDLIRSQQIALPPDLTEEQKQQLIRTLLLRQLHLSQSPEKEEGTGSTIVGLLQESQVEQATSQAQSDITGPVTGANSTSTGNEVHWLQYSYLHVHTHTHDNHVTLDYTPHRKQECHLYIHDLWENIGGVVQSHMIVMRDVIQSHMIVMRGVVQGHMIIIGGKA